ncbi:MAG: hypothetical protein HC893_15105 [Chloroflexaceae bacterium]|nr:hypothetical protein [Chloroflexaceae bacterium]
MTATFLIGTAGCGRVGGRSSVLDLRVRVVPLLLFADACEEGLRLVVGRLTVVALLALRLAVAPSRGHAAVTLRPVHLALP